MDERFHQASNGIGKWNEVKETSMRNLANEVAVETIVDCTGSRDAPVKATIIGRLIFDEETGEIIGIGE